MGVPSDPTVVHCVHLPILRSPRSLIPPSRPIPGVSKPQKRWLLGRGGGNEKTRGAKVKNAKKKVDFRAQCPPVGVPRGSVRPRGVPPISAAARFPRIPIVRYHLSYIPYRPRGGDSKPPQLRVYGDGRRKGGNERLRMANSAHMRAARHPVGVPRGSVRFRQFSRQPTVPMSP